MDIPFPYDARSISAQGFRRRIAQVVVSNEIPHYLDLPGFLNGM